MTDELTIPPVPVDAQMLPEPLSFKIDRLAQKVASGWEWVISPHERREMAIELVELAHEAEALEARVRNGRTKP